jgi:hypothetical protein
MKTIRVTKRSRHEVLHIEAPGCVVNIRHGLKDVDGHEVTSIQVIADQYTDDEWHLPDHEGLYSVGVRVRKCEKVEA